MADYLLRYSSKSAEAEVEAITKGQGLRIGMGVGWEPVPKLTSARVGEQGHVEIGFEADTEDLGVTYAETILEFPFADSVLGPDDLQKAMPNPYQIPECGNESREVVQLFVNGRDIWYGE
jgi:hypothetical protein